MGETHGFLEGFTVLPGKIQWFPTGFTWVLPWFYRFTWENPVFLRGLEPGAASGAGEPPGADDQLAARTPGARAGRGTGAGSSGRAEKDQGVFGEDCFGLGRFGVSS